MKKESATGKAEVVDYRREVDGVENPNFGSKEKITVEYPYDYDVLENALELSQKFAPDALLELANQRLKATANSGARQKAIKIYEMTGDDLAREEFIKAYLSLPKNKNKTRAQAELAADAAMAG